MKIKSLFLLISLIYCFSPLELFSQAENKQTEYQKKEPIKITEELQKRKQKINKKERLNKKKSNKKEETTESNVPIFDDEYSKFSYGKLKKTAKKTLEKGNTTKTLFFLNRALYKAKNNRQKLYCYSQLAEINFQLKDYELAKSLFQKAISINTKRKKYPLLEFQLANSFKYLGEYENAISNYKLFKLLEKDNKKMHWYHSKARQEIKGCVFAQEYKNNKPKFKVENAGKNVNSSSLEYGPDLINNKLYFSKINSKNNNNENTVFSKIYFSELFNDEIELFQDFSKTINSENIHIGNPSFSHNGKIVYYTQCNIKNVTQSDCKIFKSIKENNEWSKPLLLNEKINIENTNNTQPQIVLQEDGTEILYFVSNREKGKGGLDIWYSKVDKDGNFSRARNMGYPINTRYDEISPFYSLKTNTFYFSSTGHKTFGGFDIFKVSKLIDGEWEEEVKNLGQPINSSVDDIDFILDQKSSNSYFVSNRTSTNSLKNKNCCNDIFIIKPTAVDIYITGNVFVENNAVRTLLKNADLYLFDSETNKKIANIDYLNGKAFIEKVKKDMKYKLLVVSDDYKDVEIEFSTIGMNKSDTLQYNLYLKNRDLLGRLLSTVYYEYNISKLRQDAPDSLRKVIDFMSTYPDIIVEIGSHTDNKGTEEYNLALSERRSLSVKNYLIYQQNIPKERVVNKWFGESQPIAPNSHSNGKDNPKGRDLNRRTEFTVVGYLKDL